MYYLSAQYMPGIDVDRLLLLSLHYVHPEILSLTLFRSFCIAGLMVVDCFIFQSPSAGLNVNFKPGSLSKI